MFCSCIQSAKNFLQKPANLFGALQYYFEPHLVPHANEFQQKENMSGLPDLSSGAELPEQSLTVFEYW